MTKEPKQLDINNSLNKLLAFVEEVASLQGNEWFKERLSERFGKSGTHGAAREIERIYEYCIRQIVKRQAEQFYAEVGFDDIKPQLIADFIRMEHFRREDNFGDFCLALFQQVEAIVNKICKDTELTKEVQSCKDYPAFIRLENPNARPDPGIGGLIFQNSNKVKIDQYLSKPILDWFFNHRFRAVLYFKFFNKKVYGSGKEFDRVYQIFNYLYQGRNLNHRGGDHSEYQMQILSKMLPKKHRYYFKFLGFLEEFAYGVNENGSLVSEQGSEFGQGTHRK